MIELLYFVSRSILFLPITAVNHVLLPRFCYYDNECNDSYVLRPFPTMWKCGVVVPTGLDHVSPHLKYLQGLSRALEILVHMKEGIKSFHLSCGKH